MHLPPSPLLLLLLFHILRFLIFLLSCSSSHKTPPSPSDEKIYKIFFMWKKVSRICKRYMLNIYYKRMLYRPEQKFMLSLILMIFNWKRIFKQKFNSPNPCISHDKSLLSFSLDIMWNKFYITWPDRYFVSQWQAFNHQMRNIKVRRTASSEKYTQPVPGWR